MKKLISLSFLCSLLILSGCSKDPAGSESTQKQTQAAKVSIQQNPQGHYQLYVNGKEYTVNGVGLNYMDDEKIVAFKKAGGNTFRTWSTEHLDQELAMAEKNDLMVAVGLDTGKELRGFDYNDEQAVAEQYQRMTAIIDKYKNHPNILCWVIANEPNQLFDEKGNRIPVNPKVYDALGDITDYIHKNDPNHPVTLAFAGADKSHFEVLMERAPQFDFLSVQLYGELADLPNILNYLDIDKPFMVTEFGPVGHWQMPTTAWGREIEEPSAIKAKGLIDRMNTAIINDPTGKVIGSFVFLWGQKQERTPTWYGMFVKSGEKTATVDELTKVWSGEYPANRAPLSTKIEINQSTAVDSFIAAANARLTAKVYVTDPDQDPLHTRWEILNEVGERSQGGHYEAEPKAVEFTIYNKDQGNGYYELNFKAPQTPGEYRLFAYSYDNQGGVGTANIPFLVE